MNLAVSDLDRRLIERAAKGEQSAFDALVARHRRAVFSLVYHMVGDREVAEELTLEVFVQAYVSLPGFRQEAAFGTWLHRITIYVALQYLRQPHVKHASAEVSLLESAVPAAEATADLVLNKETVGLVVAAMQELPQAQRAAVVLRYLHEMSFPEIGEVLGIPTDTARTRVFHGTRLLREKLQAMGILPACRRGGGQ